jgi:hypothetical protein
LLIIKIKPRGVAKGKARVSRGGLGYGKRGEPALSLPLFLPLGEEDNKA